MVRDVPVDPPTPKQSSAITQGVGRAHDRHSTWLQDGRHALHKLPWIGHVLYHLIQRHAVETVLVVVGGIEEPRADVQAVSLADPQDVLVRFNPIGLAPSRLMVGKGLSES